VFVGPAPPRGDVAFVSGKITRVAAWWHVNYFSGQLRGSTICLVVPQTDAADSALLPILSRHRSRRLRPSCRSAYLSKRGTWTSIFEASVKHVIASGQIRPCFMWAYRDAGRNICSRKLLSLFRCVFILLQFCARPLVDALRSESCRCQTVGG